MIWQGIIALVFAVVCGALSFGVERQTREWNRIIGRTDWDQTITGYFLVIFCGMASGLLGAFSLACFYSAGYNA
ncbi:hypothetical protein POLUDNITSA_00830 [Brevundimonas phage vB_BpoS-Poludnitsa]|nr:hypothetical protein POLUDNITSA_00830 [Brevundimonas phage vB_BpoS-Poludnitsa]